jgi:hypothetical protein
MGEYEVNVVYIRKKVKQSYKKTLYLVSLKNAVAKINPLGHK